ncbi:MAG: hypothetical protein F6K31_27760 [Symploca sp. SIO2G7]|nr:hypothetical protein [Symploca sp. SIO2G7]
MNTATAGTTTSDKNLYVPFNSVATIAAKTSDYGLRKSRESLLLSKTGKINNGEGKKAQDILGFDYLVHDDNSQCLKYYVANSRLMGIMKPEPVPCPCGIIAIKNYKITYVEAIEIFHSLNCGDTFTGIRLSWPLTLEINEPVWHLDITLGTVIIGADSGKPICISR